MEITNLILLLAVSLFSSVIGSVIGTAMLILPPAMIFLGIPVHTAIATARFSMLGIAFGNLAKFSMKERIQLKYVIHFAIAGVAGSLLSSLFLKNIDEYLLKIIIGIFMLAISIFILFEDYIKPKKIRLVTAKHHAFSILGGLFVGAYMGIIGGGGATIIIFLLVFIYGLSFQDALANQKAVTLPISIITTIVFVYQGLIDYGLGVPLLLVNIAGGWIGAGIVLRFNNKWLKRILVPVIVLMALRLISH